MEFFFKPVGIAVIGASANELKGGYAIFKNLINGYQGKIYPVNPRYTEIEGVVCYPSIDEIQGPLDMAIVFVPAPKAVQAVKACAMRGIKGVIIQSAGFAETGRDGMALQKELQQIQAEFKIRIWGPNCMGIVDAVNRHVFSFVTPGIWEDGLEPGSVSLIVQSGMLSAGFLIDMVSHGTMGISKACSIGNKLDVNECDILEYLIDDPDTAVIGTYLESIPDGRRFLMACRKSTKPIVVLKGGKSAKGAAAALSHTASLAGNGAVISGALAQAGVVEANDFKQMLDLCRTLSIDRADKTPQKGGVAVLTFSGGAGIVSADFMDAMGLEITTLSPKTFQQLKTVFPEWMPPSNPVDLWPAMEKNGPDKVYREAFKAVDDDPGVDAILFHAFIGKNRRMANISYFTEIVKAAKKPIFCWLLGHRENALIFQKELQSLGVPVFRELRRAVECMAAFFQYKNIPVETGGGTVAAPFKFSDSEMEMLEKESGVIDEYRSKKILARTGIPIVTEKIVGTPEDAQTCGSKFGFPVVMKGLAKGEVHKTEQGLVRLGIKGEDEVKKHFTSLKKTVPDAQILVQKQITGEPELIAGLIRDPQFGPCVMCGFGGIMAEVLNDTAFALAPLNKKEALELINRLKTQVLLNGFRNYPPLDRDAFADVLVNLGNLGQACPRIREIDINPFIISKGQPIAVDASIVLDDELSLNA